MNAWKRICCPIDFSLVSRRAMEEAAILGWRFGGDITLLHVDELAPLSSPASVLTPAEVGQMAALERERQLELWRTKVQQIATTRVDYAVVPGDPVAEIISFAEKGRYDVIVMGTHGRSGRDRVPFGSVAQKVILDAPCPVLVVNARQRPMMR